MKTIPTDIGNFKQEIIEYEDVKFILYECQINDFYNKSDCSIVFYRGKSDAVQNKSISIKDILDEFRNKLPDILHSGIEKIIDLRNDYGETNEIDCLDILRVIKFSNFKIYDDDTFGFYCGCSVIHENHDLAVELDANFNVIEVKFDG